MVLSNKLKSKKNLIFAVTAVVLIGLLAWMFGPKTQPSGSTEPKKATLLINGQTINVTLPKSDLELAKGLMGVETMPENEGMLFEFSNSDKHAFWMYKTLIPLDILWINERKDIVYISKHTPPCKQLNPLKCPTYAPDAPAKFVLELNAGWADKYKVLVGNTVTF